MKTHEVDWAGFMEFDSKASYNIDYNNIIKRIHCLIACTYLGVTGALFYGNV